MSKLGKRAILFMELVPTRARRNKTAHDVSCGVALPIGESPVLLGTLTVDGRNASGSDKLL